MEVSDASVNDYKVFLTMSAQTGTPNWTFNCANSSFFGEEKDTCFGIHLGVVLILLIHRHAAVS